MRLTIKEPEINIGVDGFEEHCQLGRAETGKKLSELVEKIEDPIVIALDGSWGSGKSFFLKCWTGAHTKENGGKAKVIYFDAFQHDFLDDPLIALTGVLSDQFDPKSKAGKAIGLAKKAVSKMWRPAARIGLAAVTAGTSEMAGAVGDAAIATSSDELSKASENFWKKEDGRRAAMGEFRAALEKLTEPDEEGVPHKIVIIIDELDRCRPDYALSMLEVIKHFFAVDNVIFVLGVNMKELENSVKARYGGDMDAGKYLQKFLHLHFSLDKFQRNSRGYHSSRQYFETLTQKHELTDYQYKYYLQTYLDNMPDRKLPNLRSCERLATFAVLAPRVRSALYDADIHIISGLLIMAAIDPSIMSLAREGRLSFEKVCTMLGLQKGRSVPDPEFADEALRRWSLCLNLNSPLTEDEQDRAGWPPSEINNRPEIVPRLAQTLWGTLQVSNID